MQFRNWGRLWICYSWILSWCWPKQWLWYARQKQSSNSNICWDSKPHYGCDIHVGTVLKGRSGYGRGKVKNMGSDCFPEWEAHSVWYRYRSQSVSHLTKSSQKDRKSQAILSTENLSNYALPVKGQFIGKLRKDQEVEQELYTVEKLHNQLLGCPAVEVLEFAVHIETVERERRINLPSCFSD